MTTSNFSRGIIEMIAAQLIFGTAGWMVVASSVAVNDMIFWRCLLGAATLAMVCWRMGLLRKGVITLSQACQAALGGAALVTGWLLLFGSLAYASISVSTAVYHTQPFILVGLSALLFKERISIGRLGWLLGAFVGMILIVQGKSSADPYAANYLLGIGMSLGAAFCYAVLTLITMRLKGVRPHLIALIQMVVGATLLTPLANFAVLPEGTRAWSFIVAFGVIGTGIVYILLYSAYQKLPTHIIGALAFIYPVAAVIVDYVALGHRLQPLQLLGIVTILIAAGGMSLGPRLLERLRKTTAL